MRALLGFFLALALPLSAAERIASVPEGPAYGDQRVLGIGANDAGQTFVVWSDFREQLTNLRGSRVDDRGELVDPYGIVLTSVVPFRADVVSDGAGWRTEFSLSFVRVGADGTVSALQPLPAPGHFTHELLGGPSLRASNGSETLIVGRRTPHGVSQLVTFRLGPNGQLLAQPTLFPPSTSFGGFLVDLFWNGSEYVLLLRQLLDLVAVRIDASGAPIGEPIELARDMRSQEIDADTAADGSIAVLYADTTGTIRVVRLAGGDLAYTGPLGSATAGGTPGAITASRHGYMVATNVGGGIAVVPMRRDLTIEDAETQEETRSAHAQKGFATDKSQEARLLVWYEEDGTGMGRLMGRRPELREKLALLGPSGDQRNPAVARIGDSHFVVWYERGAAANHVKGMLFDYRNEALLFEPVTIGSAVHPAAGDSTPAVVWTGHYFLVAWHDALQHLHLSRVTAGGVVVHSERLLPPGGELPPQLRPVLVRAGSVVYLVYQSGEAEAPCIIFPCVSTPAEIDAIRFNLTGQRIDSAPIVIANNLSSRPDAAWDGRLLRVVWHRKEQIHARDLDAYGNVFESGVPPIAGETTSILARDGELVIAADVELWREGTAVEQPLDGVPAIFIERE